jgi:formamidopyrimidine-DNA glycosylase
MPELPEVEVTRRGIEKHLVGRRLERAVLRAPSLRYPVPAGLAERLIGRRLASVQRRGKYLLLEFAGGHLLIHLGMSGSLRFVERDAPAGRHDHADFIFGARQLRLTDPRRFGALIWLEGDPFSHPLLASLGVEPLSRAFSAAWLKQALAGKRVAIKQALMDPHLVVGIGNIYAAESLFRAGIDPRRPAGSLSLARLERLVRAIKTTLNAAIRAGGSTLRDFCGPEGFGDFQARHQVYGRAGAPCLRCATTIRALRQGQRTTYFCPRCQR